MAATNMTTLRLAGALLVAGSLLLTGCGRVSAGAAPVPSAAPKQLAADLPLDTPITNQNYGMTSGTGTGVNLGAVTPAPGACVATAGCDVHAQLVVGNVEKTKSGFLWRKLTIKGTVTNRGAAALSGEIMVRFKKSGSVVQSEYIAIANLAPGQSQSYDAKSSVTADDVEVTARAL